jgi:hypothetical protein
MKTKTYFTFRVDIWDDAGDSILELRLPQKSQVRIRESKRRSCACRVLRTLNKLPYLLRHLR